MSTTKQMTHVQQAGQALNLMESNIAAALPKNIPSERFLRTAQMALQSPIIAEAINNGADKSSLYDAVSKCAADGLVLDGREAALVPFKGKIQYMPMVAGIIKKAYNSGEIASLSSHVVHGDDFFSYELGDNEHIKHIPSDKEDPGAIVRVYAIGKLKGGGVQRVVMSKSQVMKHKKVAKTKFIWDGPWEEDMWEKTALKKLAKRLPQSSELSRLFESDNETIDLEPQVEKEIIPETTPGKDNTPTSASDIIKNSSKEEGPGSDSYEGVAEGILLDDNGDPIPQDDVI